MYALIVGINGNLSRALIYIYCMYGICVYMYVYMYLFIINEQVVTPQPGFKVFI